LKAALNRIPAKSSKIFLFAFLFPAPAVLLLAPVLSKCSALNKNSPGRMAGLLVVKLDPEF
jgi:hypothetical protein